MMSVKLSRAQVAQMLQITPKTLSAWEKAGRIPTPARDGRGWRQYDEGVITAIREQLGLAGAREERREAGEPVQISARNRLQGVVKEIAGDGLLCEVVLDLGN